MVAASKAALWSGKGRGCGCEDPPPCSKADAKGRRASKVAILSVKAAILSFIFFNKLKVAGSIGSELFDVAWLRLDMITTRNKQGKTLRLVKTENASLVSLFFVFTQLSCEKPGLLMDCLVRIKDFT